MSMKHVLAIGLLAALAGCCTNQPDKCDNCCKPKSPATQKAAGDASATDERVISLFDGKTLKNWKSSDFGGDAETKVEDGQLIVGAGATLSGVTWKGPELPTLDYEIELDARKMSGDDFFLALTFPYGKAHATFVVGGWGGGLVGISSIDGFDAANNETAKTMDFKKDQWYHIRLKVTKEKLQAWIDEEQMVDFEVGERKVDLRIDIENAKPLGMSTYQTIGAYKNIILKKL